MKVLISVITALFFSVSAFAQERLPNTSLTTLDGQRVSITEEIQKTDLTVISFWATWCVPCRKELENIQLLYEEWQEDFNMQLIAVSIDDSRSQNRVLPYVNGKGFTYNVLLDANRRFFQAMNGNMPPLTIIVNREGEVLDIKTGYIEGDEFLLEEKLEKFFKLRAEKK